MKRIDELRGAGTKDAVALEAVAAGAEIDKKNFDHWRKDTNPRSWNAIAALQSAGALSEEAAEAEYSRIVTEHEKDRKAAAERADEPADANKPSQHQLMLSEPPADRRASHYASRSIKVRGRDAQQKRLRDFLDAPGGFLWIQLAGEGGQGKSRLALEVWREREPAWHCGLLEDSDIADFKEGWKDWQPERPTLIIADYVVGREGSIGPILRALARRTDLRQPVRLLLVERKRWDRSDVLGADGGRADWFVALNDRHDGADASIADAQFKDDVGPDGVIELLKLTPDELAGIVIEIADRPSLQLEPIKKQLADIDREGRPLYACFLGEVLKDDPERGPLTMEELLDEVLDKDRARRWSSVFKGQPPWIGEDTPAFRLAAVATMIDGVDFSKHRPLGSPFDAAPLCRREACVMTDGPLPKSRPPQEVPALQPDILGEWFVLRAVQEGLPIDAILSAAWWASPEKMSAFLQRLSRDFARITTTTEFLAVEGYGDEALNAFASVSAAVLSGLYSAKIAPPRDVVRALERAAKGGDPKAMTGWAYCLNTGFGVARDDTKAVAWYRKAATEGESSSMTNLGICYEQGRGVEKDLMEAVAWYRKGADAGGGRAMMKLGFCFDVGIGVKQDMKKAVVWYRRGADVGNGPAMTHLGICYQWIRGLRRDLTKAVAWYRKGAEAGDGQAMYRLGQCYAEGNGVAQDDTEAVVWYRKGAELGDTDALKELAASYKSGRGVAPDLTIARELERKLLDGQNDN